MPNEAGKILPGGVASPKLALRTFILPRSTLNSWRFWLTLSAVAALAILHTAFQPAAFTPGTGSFYYLPIAFFWVPVIYGAWNFGFSGGLVTGVWAVIVSLPDFVFFDLAENRGYEITQVGLMVALACFVGYLADQKRAQQKAARLYASHLTSAREEERRKLSRDLHDGIVQKMVNVCQNLDSIKYFSPDLPTSTRAKLLDIRRDMEDLVSETREVSKNLRPTILDDIGMVNALRQLMTDLTRRSGIEAHLEVEGSEQPFPRRQQLAVFRIAQEALRNVERHSGARQVDARITFLQSEVRLEIKDNGRGFLPFSSPQALSSAGKFGVLGMSEHAEMAGGWLKVQSAPGQGTRVTAGIALENSADSGADAAPAA